MTLTSDAKFEGKLTLGSKNDMRAVANLKNCTLMCYFCQWHAKFQLKKHRRIISHDTEKIPNFEEKLTFCLENDMRNLVNFNASSGKSENVHFDGLLL